MKIFIDANELEKRIELNYTHLEDDPYYHIENVFAPKEYDWYGDKEGRALLAFVSLYKIRGKKIACMDALLGQMTEKTNSHMFFGPESGKIIYEQQLSGHSWLLRGLCEHYEQFGDSFSFEAIKSISEYLFLPISGRVKTYPTDREQLNLGDVSGSEIGTIDSWRLSSDVGCAFMSIDGLSHAYKVTKDTRILCLLDEMIDVFMSIDKLGLRVQTHCTLSAARGMVRLYFVTKNEKYLNFAKEIYNLYVYGGGMTYTYQNLNWWGRPDTWTEPCAIVDSLMLSLELYKATGDDGYRRLAARVYKNGLATAQRDNGGAGTDTTVCKNSPWVFLKTEMYEAFFCCTMRLSEGLWYINENKELLYTESSGVISKNENGVYTDGDTVLAQISRELEPYAEQFYEVDGIKLTPIVKYYRVPRTVMEASEQRIVF